ncbi:hypothetical protein F4801DRAFT_531838 [Xylaria longipes]|nr:hypothetical protein F4801DRAFT_531838 [Xylaria longipes]
MRTTSLEGLETCCAALASPSFDLHRLAARAGRNIDSVLLLAGQGNMTSYGWLRMWFETGQTIKTLRSGKGKTPPVAIQRVINDGSFSFIDGFSRFSYLLMEFLEPGMSNIELMTLFPSD